MKQPNAFIQVHRAMPLLLSRGEACESINQWRVVGSARTSIHMCGGEGERRRGEGASDERVQGGALSGARVFEGGGGLSN